MARFIYKSGSLELNEKTYIMGILNITPDSFSDGGRYQDTATAVFHAMEMEHDGADIIDMGAQSTRPGHTPVTAEEEWHRLEPVLKAVRQQTKKPISIDTYYPQVAVAALDRGADIINDVSGSTKEDMPKIAARYGAGLIMMHAGGGAEDFGRTENESALINEVHNHLKRALSFGVKVGLAPEQICLDPGIGFGKNRRSDLALVSRLPEIIKDIPQVAVLVGASRKRVIAACCDPVPPINERLAGTLAIHSIAQWNGAHILRAHDVKEAVQAARVVDALKSVSH
jgi:dihydropteroate synthase